MKYKVIEVSSDTNIGGAGKCLLTLLEHFDYSRFEVKVILPKNSLLKPRVEELGIEVIEAEGIADQSLNMSAVRELRNIFKREKPDLVHTHASMSARIAARQAGCKIIYTRHSVFEPPKKISRGPGKLINGMVNNYLADGIIAVAVAAKQNLTNTGVNQNKIRVILNGVEGLKELTPEEKKLARERFGVREDEKVVSIVARLEDIKGHEYFIDAAKILLDEGIKAKFFIAGTGSYESVLKAKVRDLGLEKDVIFTGFINDTDKLLGITDVQVNASYGTEATSLALLEGMSIGVPAVVSDFGGNPGVIVDGENGILAWTKSAKSIAQGVERLLTEKRLYDETSAGARKRFAEKFTAERMTRNTENYYVEIMGGKRNGKK